MYTAKLNYKGIRRRTLAEKHQRSQSGSESADQSQQNYPLAGLLGSLSTCALESRALLAAQKSPLQGGNVNQIPPSVKF